ncbi:hypothetical protein Pmani_021004 [Petrolisthes manimaculis]|uniref:Uncharacterized protein n=1 Tax=Petrolisthes manimaculis TaxID=1843537 RepID=A0AAE1U5X0_9EUCA|nr:hypothetical protein Pmani_021004 [Petrolisthes manimaculis]
MGVEEKGEAEDGVVGVVGNGGRGLLKGRKTHMEESGHGDGGRKEILRGGGGGVATGKAQVTAWGGGGGDGGVVCLTEGTKEGDSIYEVNVYSEGQGRGGGGGDGAWWDRRGVRVWGWGRGVWRYRR